MFSPRLPPPSTLPLIPYPPSSCHDFTTPSPFPFPALLRIASRPAPPRSWPMPYVLLSFLLLLSTSFFVVCPVLLPLSSTRVAVRLFSKSTFL
ncbi:hypothetical protein BOTBODRAFT_467780 [Botryobasidium botryosum FD-172 SS1]|uniref:Uncharacterized protein n=1 Tax=Botryobasidium botryosum (strain FD-172 SS1) TaxID=930990 RepID=A0A067M6F4_BOTB1|nr:hypothetical protein BOTBODRAFT_467780 [Botryobasidium botryosum FD-172 SS1]